MFYRKSGEIYGMDMLAAASGIAECGRCSAAFYATVGDSSYDNVGVIHHIAVSEVETGWGKIRAYDDKFIAGVTDVDVVGVIFTMAAVYFAFIRGNTDKVNIFIYLSESDYLLCGPYVHAGLHTGVKRPYAEIHIDFERQHIYCR